MMDASLEISDLKRVFFNPFVCGLAIGSLS